MLGNHFGMGFSLDGQGRSARSQVSVWSRLVGWAAVGVACYVSEAGLLLERPAGKWALARAFVLRAVDLQWNQKSSVASCYLIGLIGAALLCCVAANACRVKPVTHPPAERKTKAWRDLQILLRLFRSKVLRLDVVAKQGRLHAKLEALKCAKAELAREEKVTVKREKDGNADNDCKTFLRERK